MIKHILIPTDGSESSMSAASFGGDLARATHARVTILSVLDDEAVVATAWGGEVGGFSGPGGDTSIEIIRRQMEKNALENLLPKTAAAAGQIDPGPDLAHVWGNAATGICDYANEHGVDLIVMGSHGRSGLKAMLLGSVSHAVTNRAPCAVTIVR